MMKQTISLFLAAALAVTLAACGAAPESTPAASAPAVSAPAVSEPADSAPADSQPAEPTADAELVGLLDDIYAAQPLELALETLPVDGSDAATAAWMVGLVEGTVLGDVEAGVVSASLINAQAYTLALLRLKDGVDLAAAGQALLDDANAGKWVCVYPDKAAVAGGDGVLCFVMADGELIDAEALTGAFADAVGGADFTAVREFSEADLGEVWDPELGLDGGAVAAVP